MLLMIFGNLEKTARAATKAVLDKLGEGLIDAPQEVLERCAATEIEKVIRAALPDPWNRDWDL